MDPRPPVVFVSYAHDSSDHIEHVVRFATRLRSLGVDAHLDEWSDAVRQDWYTWMAERIATADFVVVVASPAYRAAGDGHAPADRNRGVQTEAALLRDRLHENRRYWEKRILPVVLPGGSVEDVPRFLTPYTTSRYEVPSLTPAGLAGLLRVLHGESTVPRPPLVPLPQFTASTPVAPHAGLDRAADDLAASVTAALSRAEDRTGDLIDLHWTEPGGTGTLATITDRYRRAASRRLLVLGGAGAGKTVAAGCLALGLLHARTGRGDVPVPVLLPVGDWHPREQGLRDWLVATLVRDHPHLGVEAGWSTTLAAALVDTARVLPVLDGFDEIAPGLRVAALHEIADSALDLVLTSRPAEYRAAAEVAGRLAADHVSLDPLTPGAVRAHFAADPRWTPVLASTGPPVEALTTPLMTALAAAVYAPGTGREPAELLALSTREAVETHLLADYVPARYAARSGRLVPGPGGTWPAADAQRWLATVAGDLRRRGVQAFGWWEVPRAVPDRTRTLVAALPSLLSTVAVVAPVVVWWSSPAPAVVALMMWALLAAGGVAARHLTRRASYAAAPVVGLVAAAAGGVDEAEAVVGYAAWFGLVYLAGAALSGSAAPTPSRTALPVGDLWAEARRRFPGAAVGGLAALVFLTVAHVDGPLPGRTWLIVTVVGLTGGFAVGLVVAACGAAVAVAVAVVFVVARLAGEDGVVEVVARWPLVAVGVGAVVAALVSAVRVVAWGFDRRVEIPKAVDARSTRTVDRNNALVQGVAAAIGIVALAEGFATVFVSGRPWSTDLAVGAAVFATVVPGKAWGQWLLFARFWLPLRGELPWRVGAFLEDAVARGVLRRTGAVYRFRHVRLRDALARPAGHGERSRAGLRREG